MNHESMTTEERIASLESRLDVLQEAHSAVTRQLAEARVDQWQARIDELELQAHLGATEASDRLAQVTAELERRWSKVRQQLSEAGATTTDVGETLRAGLESAYKDVRAALIESRKQFVDR